MELQFIQIFFISLNCKDLPSLSLEWLDNLVKKYDQLKLIILDEISLIGNIILKFIDLWLRSIKPIHTKFFGNPSVTMEMCWLQTIAWWDVIVPKPHTCCDSHVLIYSLNIRSLLWHKIDVFLDDNLQTSHTLYLNETHFNTLTSNNTSLNIDTRTHSMIIYDNFTTLSSHETLTSLGVEHIATTFNANTRKAIHIITIYKPSTLSLSMFIIHLQKFLDLMWISCPLIIIGNFNIDMFDQNSTQPNELQSFMDQYSMKLQLKNYNNLWIPYWSHIEKCTHSTMHARSYWNLLDWP